MSAELIWEIIKNNNSFLVKKNGTTFTSEPGNLVNKHAFKYSMLVNPKAIGVTAAEGNKGVKVIVQKSRSLNKPAKRYAAFVVSRAGTRRAAKTVTGLTKAGYRKDLEKFALARVSKIMESQKATKKTVKTGRVTLKK